MKEMIASSIAKKIIMGVTGLFLCVFLVVHMSGNLLLFRNDGGTAFNHYSEFMSTNGFIRFNEYILVLGLLFHALDSLVLTLSNWRSRPVRYRVNRPGSNSSLPSRNMGLTGSILLVFLVVHLKTFFIGQRIQEGHSSMYESVRIAFQNPYYSFFYLLALAILGFHLYHGFQSAFQSLGLRHSRYTPVVSCIGVLFAVVIPAGFAVMPIYFYFV